MELYLDHLPEDIIIHGILPCCEMDELFKLKYTSDKLSNILKDERTYTTLINIKFPKVNLKIFEGYSRFKEESKLYYYMLEAKVYHVYKYNTYMFDFPRKVNQPSQTDASDLLGKYIKINYPDHALLYPKYNIGKTPVIKCVKTDKFIYMDRTKNFIYIIEKDEPFLIRHAKIEKNFGIYEEHHNVGIKLFDRRAAPVTLDKSQIDELIKEGKYI